jgi:hypothetical protein
VDNGVFFQAVFADFFPVLKNDAVIDESLGLNGKLNLFVDFAFEVDDALIVLDFYLLRKVDVLDDDVNRLGIFAAD